MGAAGSTAAGSGATSAGAEDNRVTVCPSGNSTKFLPLHLHSPSFTLKTHKEGTTLGENIDCKMEYVMGSCSQAEVFCNVTMDGKGANCEDGDRVSIKTSQTEVNLCGAGGNTTTNVTKSGKGLVTIEVKTDGMNSSIGGECSVRCISEENLLGDVCNGSCTTGVCGAVSLNNTAATEESTNYIWACYSCDDECAVACNCYNIDKKP